MVAFHIPWINLENTWWQLVTKDYFTRAAAKHLISPMDSLCCFNDRVITSNPIRPAVQSNTLCKCVSTMNISYILLEVYLWRSICILSIEPFRVRHLHGTSICRDESSPAVLALVAMFTWPTWGAPGSCRPQMHPMLAPWTLLSG